MLLGPRAVKDMNIAVVILSKCLEHVFEEQMKNHALKDVAIHGRLRCDVELKVAQEESPSACDPRVQEGATKRQWTDQHRQEETQ